MQSQNIQESSNLDALKSPVLQAERLDASDIIALQLAESERTDSVNAAGDAERINLDELLESDFASLTTSLKISYADLQARVAELTQELSSARAARQEELAEKELEGQKSDLDYSLAAAQLAEAAARLKSIQKLRKK